jgi:hypothetical protein
MICLFVLRRKFRKYHAHFHCVWLFCALCWIFWILGLLVTMRYRNTYDSFGFVVLLVPIILILYACVVECCCEISTHQIKEEEKALLSATARTETLHVIQIPELQRLVTTDYLGC